MSEPFDVILIKIGAVNPSLTIIANALRIGDHLLERLAAQNSAAEPQTVKQILKTTVAPQLAAVP